MTNVKHIKDKQQGDVYIGRPGPWGNPFVIGRDGDRAEVIRKYRAWALNDTFVKNNVKSLKDKTLVCYCAPLACHGDVLKELAEKEC